MTDPFSLEARIEGTVARRGETRAPKGARIVADLDGLHAELDDGTRVDVPWRGVRLARAAGSGAIQVIAADRSATVSSEDPDFVRALEAAGGNDLNDQLSRLQGQTVSSGWRHKLSCTLVLVLIVAVLWAIPRLFRGAVDASVAAMPYSVDEAIGEQVFGVLQVGEEVTDEAVRGAIQAILDRLAPTSALLEAQFQFKVVDREEVNAFALPGGYLVVFTGLILEAEGPDQVAGVLAHEMAHVTLRHGLERIAHQVGLWTAASLLFGDVDALTSIAVRIFSEASANDYSRDQETEADLEGTRMLIEARVDPSGLASFFSMLEREHGDVPESLGWLSTHPQHEARVAAIRTFAAEHAAGVSYEPLEVDWDAARAALGK